jgi:hypothetical protein
MPIGRTGQTDPGGRRNRTSAIRHPIYSGIMLAMAGTAIAASPYWLNAVAILGAHF